MKWSIVLPVKVAPVRTNPMEVGGIYKWALPQKSGGIP